MYDHSPALQLTICGTRRRVPAVNAGAVQAWFIAGTIPLMLAGGLHVVLTLRRDFLHRSARIAEGSA